MNMLKKRNNKKLLLSIFTTFLVVVLMTGSVFAADWASFQKDNYNTGATSDSVPTSTSATIDSVDLPNHSWYGIDCTPLVISESGTEYAYVLTSTSSDVRAYKIKCSDQSIPSGWTDGVVVDSDGGFHLSTPAIDGTTMYVAVRESSVTKVKKVTGINTSSPSVSVIKTFSSSNEQPNTPIAYEDGYIYLGTWIDGGTGKYYKINVSTGATDTFTPASGNGFYWAGAALIDGSSGTDFVVFGGDDSKIYVRDRSDLSSVNTYTIKGSGQGQETGAAEIRSAICYNISDNEIYFTDKGGYVWCLEINTVTGALTYKWNADIGTSTSTPSYVDGKVYVGQGGFGSSGKIYCYDTSSGSKAWEYTTTGGVQGSTVVKKDGSSVYIYYTTNNADGKGYCLRDNGRSRSIRWSTSSGTYTLQGMAACGDYVVFGNDYGTVYIVK